MTELEMRDLRPALAAYLDSFQFCCAYTQTFGHLNTYVQGLLSDLPRKSVEPIALAFDTPVRTLQEFLRDHAWDHEQVRDLLQRRVVATLAECPAGDDLGTVGLIDETAVAKKGVKTPGIQRQWCGRLGKTENCIVTVHLGVARGQYKTLIDGALYLPRAWARDPQRCKEAHIPEEDRAHRTKWRIALDLLGRAEGNRVACDWWTFDEGYGACPAFLFHLSAAGLRFVGEVPKSMACRVAAEGETPPARKEKGQRAHDVVQGHEAFTQAAWQAVRLPRQTLPAQAWQVKAAQVWLSSSRGWSQRPYWLIWARNERTGEVKYFVSNAPATEAVGRLMRVAFCRWNVEHCFRISKGELGLGHFEGRSYKALMRHLTLSLVAMGFVTEQAQRHQKKTPA